MEVEHHTVVTPDGWALSLQRPIRPGASTGGSAVARAPVLFVPGYGMNAWIVRYHPSGRSFASVLLDAGLDPWGIDLRGTASSRGPRGGARLADQALVDLPAVIDHIRSVTGVDAVHAIGCSLGGSLLLGHAALSEEASIGRLALIGAPLHWGDSLRERVLGRVLQTAGAIPMRGTRRFARFALPLAATLAPAALRLYLNPRITDVGCVDELVRTVEDPVPAINRAIGAWMRSELRLADRPVAPALARFVSPMLVVHGSGDGIVGHRAALSAVGATGGPVEVIRVDHPSGQPVGHADMFVSDIAPTQVFEPVARFLAQPPP